MVKIIYEGENLQNIIDDIKGENFIIVDKENRKHYPEESFILLVNRRRDLDEADEREYIYLTDPLKKELDKSDFPERIFLKELSSLKPFPSTIGLSGDMQMAWGFIQYLLEEYLFSIGLSARGYSQGMFKSKMKSLNPDERKRLGPANNQPLQIFWEDYSKKLQLFFWSGREEDLFSFKERLIDDQHVWMVFKKRKHLIVSENQHLYLWKRLKHRKKNFRALWEALTSAECP